MIEVISAEMLGRTLRITLVVNGIKFKRLSDKWHEYPPIYGDIYGKVNGCEALTPEQDKELEAIFKAWCLENKIVNIDDPHSYISEKSTSLG